ncbi:MAG: integrase core domain-containing protein [Nitrospirota bacterium]
MERFWRSVKYEAVYLHACAGVREAKKGVERYVMRYHQRRPHTALDGNTPDEGYVENVLTLPKTA